MTRICLTAQNGQPIGLTERGTNINPPCESGEHDWIWLTRGESNLWRCRTCNEERWTAQTEKETECTE